MVVQFSHGTIQRPVAFTPETVPSGLPTWSYSQLSPRPASEGTRTRSQLARDPGRLHCACPDVCLFPMVVSYFDYECLFFRRHSTSIIMAVVYGYEVARRDDPIVDVVDRAVNLAVASIRPEVAAFLGFFPFRKSLLMMFRIALSLASAVRYIPTWLPGASFKRTALLSQKYADDMVETPFHFVQQSLVRWNGLASL
jgi:hypothetical protein